MWTHARINWYDGDVGDFPPRIRILRRAAGSSLIRVDSRITVMGPRYRVDFLDGSPARLYDGATGWIFPYFRADSFYVPGPVIPVLARPGRAASVLDPLRPGANRSRRPTEVEGVECSPVVAIDDPSDEFFTWSGPARTLDEAARANRQWRSTGGGPGLAGLRP